MKRTPLKPMSDKRRARIPARKAAMEIVRERDRCCQFWLRLVVYCQTAELVNFASQDGREILDRCKDAFDYPTPDCGGPLDGHEPVHRSQGGDPTNPDDIVLVCRVHHDFAHSYPIAAKLLDL